MHLFRLLTVLTVLSASAYVTPRAAAQTLRVRVVEEGSERVVPGALITLHSDGGQVLHRALADERGRLAFDLSTAGRFRLTVARIGHRSLHSDPINVGAGETIEYEARMPVAPVLLPDLVVAAEDTKRCGADGRTQAASGVLWSEISKALWAFELSDARPPNLESITYQRRLNRSGEVVQATSTDWRPADRRPFTSPSPDRLLKDGFVTTSDAGKEYHGPDAALLLSDEFARRYCFAVQPSSDTAQVGLAFRPADARSRQIGVEGILWVDRQSAALRALDFTYTGLDGLASRGRLGGQLAFTQVGREWIVGNWRITVPFIVTLTGRHLRTGQRTQTDSLAGYIERGGEARIRGGDGSTARGLLVEGVVWDSIAGQPLRQARVSAAGGSFMAETDDEGRYRLQVSAPGTYAMTVDHPVLRAYGLGSLLAPARAERSAATTTNVGTPSAGAVLTQRCRGYPASANASGLVFFDLGNRWADAVEISWTGAKVGGITPRFVAGEDGVWVVSEVDGHGLVAICGVPLSAELSVRTRAPGRLTAVAPVPPRDRMVTVVSLPRPE